MLLQIIDLKKDVNSDISRDLKCSKLNWSLVLKKRNPELGGKIFTHTFTKIPRSTNSVPGRH